MHELLKDNYKTRSEAFEKCRQATWDRGYSVFALQDGGACYTGPKADSTYKGRGSKSDACKPDGMGGVEANQVYEMYYDNWAVPKKIGHWFDYNLDSVSFEFWIGPWIMSRSKVVFAFANAEMMDAGGFSFDDDALDKPRMWVTRCGAPDTSHFIFKSTPQHWRVTVDKSSGIRFIIHHDGKEVLNFELSDRTCHMEIDIWKERWSRKIERIAFGLDDTVSQYYRAYSDAVAGTCPSSVDGGWSEFGDWSECSESVECGGGFQTRTRKCNSPAPVGSGADCEGEDIQSQLCNAEPCPDSCADATKIFQEKLNDMKEELDDAKEELKDMKKELNDTREELDKATDSCPGEGIYMVPAKWFRKKITKKALKQMKKNGESEDIRYLSPWLGVKLTSDVVNYIECFTTV